MRSLSPSGMAMAILIRNLLPIDRVLCNWKNKKKCSLKWKCCSRETMPVIAMDLAQHPGNTTFRLEHCYHTAKQYNWWLLIAISVIKADLYCIITRSMPHWCTLMDERFPTVPHCSGIFCSADLPTPSLRHNLMFAHTVFLDLFLLSVATSAPCR